MSQLTEILAASQRGESQTSSRRKHDGHLERMDADHVDIPSPLPEDQLPAVDEALDRLAAVNPRAAEVVNFRFFADLTEEQIAQQLDISVATVERTWAFARAWLFHEIQQDLGASSPVRENAPENRT